jgi:hypothetical protein
LPDRTLTLRDLNRTLLARQLLLERAPMSVPAAVEHLAGLQAQQPASPYIALWTRLRDFTRDDLARLIEDHSIVKATMMRATLHVVTAADFVHLRPVIQPALDAAAADIVKQRGVEIDIPQIIAAGQRILADGPHSFEHISDALTAEYPGVDVGAMRYTLRMRLPLVQVPTDTRWSYPGNPQFTLAESWLGRPIADDTNPRDLILRYLEAFGPATVADIESWSGLSKLKPAVEALQSELVTYRDERKRTLFDVPDMPFPDVDSPSPVRYLPEYDNILRAHKDRTRIVADAHRKQVYLPALRVASTVLIDGFVGGAWTVAAKKGAATLIVTPFAPLDAPTRATLTEEGERLLHFIEPDAKSYDIHIAG